MLFPVTLNPLRLVFQDMVGKRDKESAEVMERLQKENLTLRRLNTAALERRVHNGVWPMFPLALFLTVVATLFEHERFFFTADSFELCSLTNHALSFCIVASENILRVLFTLCGFRKEQIGK